MTDVRPAEHANELSKIDKTRFCVAFFVFSFAWMLALQIVAAVLLPQRLADIAPDSKDAIFGVLNSATALASLISNLVVGNMSDRTRSIFGRRTPWIASGGIVAGISLFLIGILPDGVSIGISYCISMVGLNMMIAPVIASLSNHIPEDMLKLRQGFYRAFSENDFGLTQNPVAFYHWACRQSYIPLANMITSAAMIGVDSTPIEGFPLEKLDQLFVEKGLYDPAVYKLSVMVAFGYRLNEPREKTRQAFEDVVEWIK